MKKNLLTVTFLLITSVRAFAQVHTDQNGIKTSVTNVLYANATQAKRYEIATIGFNSYHWQAGGIIIVELFEQSFGVGYEKYYIEIGFGQGANSGTPLIKLAESKGIYHLAKLVLGTAYNTGTSFGGYDNKAIPIYLDVRTYAGYIAKLTYIHNRVEEVSELNQIKINQAPSGSDISDFNVSGIPDADINTSGNLTITGSGNHYIQNGNVGIGTSQPDSKLTVNGKIHAEEVKIDLSIPAPDYVFEKGYPLKTLSEVQQYISENKHLPEMPSARVMKEEGLNMGLLQMKLLQKIEELTLYIIEQDKKQADLASEVHALKSVIAGPKFTH